jgi:16S rRNA (adenine1518-N6/adenine1519-N6)-dimethyltransferase
MEINTLKTIFGRYHIRPNKLLGQNFLLSEEVLDEIVRASELTKADTVLEIGPGLGFLTKRLAEKAGKVIAVEKDRKLARILQKIFSTPSSSPPYQPRRNRRGQGGERVGVVKIIQGDILELTTCYLQLNTAFKVVANIPYYLTGKILQKFLTSDANTLMHANDTNGFDKLTTGSRHSSRLFLMVLLLQKEVAERIVAKPGEMSILSVSVQFYADPEIVSFVGKENFYPAPEVDSAIVRFTPPQSPPFQGGETKGGFRPRFAVDEKKFFQLVKIGFANKRKQLKNNLQVFPLPNPPHKGEGSKNRDSLPSGERKNQKNSPPFDGRGKGRVDNVDYKKLLLSIGLDPLCRAQDLSLADWGRLYKKLYNMLK